MFHAHFFHFFTGAFGLTIAALCLIPYFLPTIIAMMRSHPGSGGIFVVNFFLGWTLLGWIVCLVWALSGNNQPYNTYDNYPPYPSQADSQDRIIAQLNQLQKLRDEGALTEEEFNRQKASILR